MYSPRIISSRQIFFLLCLFLFVPGNCLSADKYESKELSPHIYVNSSVVDKKYTLADVRAIFAMRKTQWRDGKRIRVFVLPDNDPLHRQFTKVNFNMLPYQFRRIWNRLIFSGTGRAPNEVKSINEMLDMLMTIPGAIGYLKDSSENPDVRMLDYE